MTEQRFHSVAPLFRVSDLGRSLDFYCDVLGLERPRLWGDPPLFAMPKRDDCIVMLAQAERPEQVVPNFTRSGSWDAYFWVRDARTLFEELRAREAVFEYELQFQEEYGNWEFAVLDPDRYSLAFGQNTGVDSWFGER